MVGHPLSCGDDAVMGGTQFESEIREQSAVLARVAASNDVQHLENLIGGRDVVFTGSGSSLFVAQLALSHGGVPAAGPSRLLHPKRAIMERPSVTRA